MKEIFFKGTVIWFDTIKGYGFIKWKDEKEMDKKDIFVHYSDIAQEGFKDLLKDQNVKFNLGTNRNGIAKAINVTVV